MKVLVLDAGNTLRKYYLFEVNEDFSQVVCRDVLRNKPNYVDEFEYFITNKEDRVRAKRIVLVRNYKELKRFIRTDFPLKIEYSETLGIDRLASALFFLEQLEEKSFIQVLMGTATCIDVVNNGKFVEGYILPGVDYLKQFSEKINLKEFFDLSIFEKEISYSNNTKLALLSWVEFLVESLAKKYKINIIISSGGNGYLLKKYYYHPSSVGFGMVYILKYLDNVIKYN